MRGLKSSENETTERDTDGGKEEAFQRKNALA